MKTNIIVTRSWSTASYGDNTETSPMDLYALGEHLNLCKDSHHRLLALNFAAHSMHGFLATRLVTTFLLVSLLIACCSLVL